MTIELNAIKTTTNNSINMYLKFRVIAIIGMIICWSTVLTAENYYSLGYGYGGSANTNSMTVEIGTRSFGSENDTFQFALGFPFIFHDGENIPEDTRDESCSNPACKDLDSEYDGTEYGLFIKAGIDPFDMDIYVSGLIGITQSNLVELAESEATSEVYEQGTSKETNFILGFGVGFFPDFFDWEMKLNIQLDVDSRRGVTAYIGWRW